MLEKEQSFLLRDLVTAIDGGHLHTILSPILLYDYQGQKSRTLSVGVMLQGTIVTRGLTRRCSDIVSAAYQL